MRGPHTLLDVRSVGPRFRFGRIMGCYEALRPGESFELAVDHDPTCMYYTLLATRGDDAFRFEYVERGPESWRVRVTRLAEDPGPPHSSDRPAPSRA